MAGVVEYHLAGAATSIIFVATFFFYGGSCGVSLAGAATSIIFVATKVLSRLNSETTEVVKSPNVERQGEEGE